MSRSEPVMFDRRSAERIRESVRYTERVNPNLTGARGVPRLPSVPQVFLGKPTSAFSSGTQITLDPCDIKGTDNGGANVAVYLKPDQSSYAMSNSTTIATTMIVPFMYGADGAAYVLGYPVIVACITSGPSSGCYTVKSKVIWCMFAGTTET